MDVVIYIITALLAIYAFLIIARAVLSWLHLGRDGSIIRAEHLTVVLTDQYLRVSLRILPVSRFGWSDLTPFVGPLPMIGREPVLV